MQTLAQRLRNEGRQKGRQEGRQEAFLELKKYKLEIAKQMLLDGFKQEVVMKYTGLNKEEIERLIN